MPTTRRAFAALTAGAALAALAPTGAAHAAPRNRRLIAHDNFCHGLSQLAAELQDGGTVTASRGVLEIDVPSGATVWFRRRLDGPVRPRVHRHAGFRGRGQRPCLGPQQLLERDRRPLPGDLFATPRGGALEEYDHLTTYYAGYGANYNTTTRLRRYVGEPGVRPLVYDYSEPLLVPNEPHRVRIVSDGSTVRWWNNGRLVFDYTDPQPYTGGHFAFRTV
ncbi:hypothetical protein SVIOM74S_09010 [Streptomyces violarus]